MFANKTVAADVSQILFSVSGELNRSVEIVVGSCSQEEKMAYLRLIGAILGTIGVDLLNPIFRQHPDLKPDDYYLPIKPSADG